MTTTNTLPVAHAIERVRAVAGDQWCNRGLAILAAAATDKKKLDPAILDLWHLNTESRDQILAVISELAESLGKPGKTIHHFRDGLGTFRPYGPAAGGEGLLRWGQGSKEDPQRAGTYRPEHLRTDSEGLHFDVQPDRQGLTNPAGRPCFEVGFVADVVPLFGEYHVIGVWVRFPGHFPCLLWFTSTAGGWKLWETDGPENFGNPTDWDWNSYSLATHIKLLGRTPYVNAQSNLLLKKLGKSHWHPHPNDTDPHDWGIRFEPVDDLHIVTTWTCDGRFLQELNSRDFEGVVPQAELVATLMQLRSGNWNRYICNQISQKTDPKPGLILPSAMRAESASAEVLV